MSLSTFNYINSLSLRLNCKCLPPPAGGNIIWLKAVKDKMAEPICQEHPWKHSCLAATPKLSFLTSGGDNSCEHFYLACTTRSKHAALFLHQLRTNKVREPRTPRPLRMSRLCRFYLAGRLCPGRWVCSCSVWAAAPGWSRQRFQPSTGRIWCRTGGSWLQKKKSETFRKTGPIKANSKTGLLKMGWGWGKKAKLDKPT